VILKLNIIGKYDEGNELKRRRIKLKSKFLYQRGNNGDIESLVDDYAMKFSLVNKYKNTEQQESLLNIRL
jgi:hypothetical protein